MTDERAELGRAVAQADGHQSLPLRAADAFVEPVEVIVPFFERGDRVCDQPTEAIDPTALVAPKAIAREIGQGVDVERCVEVVADRTDGPVFADDDRIDQVRERPLCWIVLEEACVGVSLRLQTWRWSEIAVDRCLR